MPEIVIRGLRDVGNGSTVSGHEMLREMRQDQQIQLWSHEGTKEQCEANWRNFLLEGTPDWEIWS